MASGKVAVVTGASRGIGAHLAHALAGAGWRVGATARDAASLTELTDRWGTAVLPLSLDVRDEQGVEGAVATVLEAFGGVDLLVNNAGMIETERPLWEADPQQWWQVIETNVRGPFLMARALVPTMLAAGGGRVVNINSGAATRANAELSAYTASKSALARITGSLHSAGFEHGLRAFDLAPGVVATDMTASLQVHRDRTEWTDPELVSDLVLALASGELDAYSGRMVRAGIDTVASLGVQARALPPDARTLSLQPWGEDDPLA